MIIKKSSDSSKIVPNASPFKKPTFFLINSAIKYEKIKAKRVRNKALNPTNIIFVKVKIKSATKKMFVESESLS